MNTLEKKKFVRDLVQSVEKMILANLDRLPDEWDGIELRQYITDKFSEQTLHQNGRRFRDYKNEILVRNL